MRMALVGVNVYPSAQSLATHEVRFSFDRIITGVYDLADTGTASQAMADLKEIKPVVTPNAGR